MKNKSFFCVIDGIDGCGSSTHTRLLGGFLESEGFNIYLTHEPSNSEIGSVLRKFLKNAEVHPSTDALLFAADRSYHYFNEIYEKLDKGYIVISDRYIEASIVYQSCQSPEISVEWLKLINKFVGKPDLTIILDIDPRISLSRKTQQSLEKFENTPFLERVRKMYLDRAKAENYSIISSDDIIEITQQKIQNIVIEKLREKGFY